MSNTVRLHRVLRAAPEKVYRAFLDSDVVPEPGWLDRLLDALAGPGVEVVAGGTYVEPVGLVGKTFALTWFFPLRGDDEIGSLDAALRRHGLPR